MAIDRERIINQLSKVNMVCDQKGIMESFNVYVNQLPTSFWNSFAERLVYSTDSELQNEVEYLLVNAAHECGYHTGHGIINSEEWDAIVGPMIEKEPEDILYGAYAVLSAWGWAKAEIVELVPDEKMVIRSYDYYESEMVEFGAAPKGCAYMLRGISAAFMDLAYGKEYDPTGKSGFGKFICEQVKGIECGDEYGEFVVIKNDG